jgi:hypothetical protein
MFEGAWVKKKPKSFAGSQTLFFCVGKSSMKYVLRLAYYASEEAVV